MILTFTSAPGPNEMPNMIETLRSNADALERVYESIQHAGSDTEALANNAYDYGKPLRIKYQGEDDTRARWRVVVPTTAVQTVKSSRRYPAFAHPAERFFRAVDIAAPSGRGARCYRISRIEQAEPVA